MSSSSGDSPGVLQIKEEPEEDTPGPSNLATKLTISNGKVPDVVVDQAASSSLLSTPRITMPVLHKSVIVATPSAVTNNLESSRQIPSPLAPTPPAMMGQSVIQGPLRFDNLNNLNRLLLVMKQAGALPHVIPSALITAPAPAPASSQHHHQFQHQHLPPPPPLRRIVPVGSGGRTIPVIDAPPLIAGTGLMLGGFNDQLLLRQSLGIDTEMNGHHRSDESLDLGASTTIGIDQESSTAQESTRKRRKRSKPNAIRKPTREEIRLAREAAQSSSTDDAWSEDAFLEEDVIIDTASIPAQIYGRQGAIVSPTHLPPPPVVRILTSPQTSSASTTPPNYAAIGQDQSASTSQSRSQKEMEEHRLRRMRNNEAVRKSRLKARLKIKQSELNCRLLVKQFGEMKQKVQSLEKDLAWEKRKNEILEEMLRRTQMNAVTADAPAPAPVEDAPPS